MPRADFLTGIVLFVVALALIGEGWRLPGAGGMVPAGGEPGRVLIFIGTVIAVLASILTARAVFAGGHRLRHRPWLDPSWRGPAIRATATALGGTLYVALLGRGWFGIEIGYTPLTLGFVFLFVVVSEWKLAPAIAGRRWRALRERAPNLAARIAPLAAVVPAERAPYAWLLFTAALQATAIALIVAYVFETQFFVRLP